MPARLPLALALFLVVGSLALFGGASRRSAALPHRAALVADSHDVWTQHNDNARTGATLVETVLDTHNVNSASFGKLFSRAVDDQIYSQPLYLAGVPIAGAVKNVVYVTTVSDSVFAFDADDPAMATPLARRNLLDAAAAGARPPSHLELGKKCDGMYMNFTGNIGVVGTPVIDVAAGTMYLVARSVEPGENFVQRLHALDITTLQDKVPPVVITGQMAGEGDGAVNGMLTFDPATSNQRSALLLHHGTIYIAWASHCDTDPFHGWVIGYDAATLHQSFVWNVTPDGSEGGIWQSGEGMSSDGTNIYVITANGTSNVQSGGRSYGSTILKIDPSKAAAPVVDWFMPYNADELNSTDNDLGTSGVLLIPGTNLLAGGSKAGTLYLLDRGNLGHFHAGSDSQIVQSIASAGTGHIHGSAVSWTSSASGTSVYIWAEYDHLKQFPLTGGKFDMANLKQSEAQVPNGMPGGMLSISANGNRTGTGIVWASHPSTGDAENQTQGGILRAFDADDVGQELWNSGMNPRDGFGNFAKFVPPTVANGRVYLATFSNQLVVYGLLAPGAYATTPASDAAVPPVGKPPSTPDAAPGAPTGGSGGSGRVDDAGTLIDPVPIGGAPGGSSGCSCGLSSAGPPRLAWSLPLLVAMLILRRRRR
jgi:MYXO-CTERM domain-containing protein